MLHYSLFRCITRIELLKLVFVNHRTKLYLNENFKITFWFVHIFLICSSVLVLALQENKA